MLELLAPAGSPEAVVAAVQNGADAVYLGLGGFNARAGAKNFTDEEFLAAVKYCHERGCKVYVTLNTLCADRETEELARLGVLVSDAGADAALVQDLGAARILRSVCPDLPLHASTQMSIHNLAGVHAAHQLGMKRVVLARELNRGQIRAITAHAPIETEVFVHGALCFCHSGQCYMSALIGRRSGNRGQCAQPCRMQYSMGRRAEDYPLSLKDNCLVDYLSELDAAGVKCVKLEGRMKRPEYTAIVTQIYHRAVHEGVAPTEKDMEKLRLAFSRDGFTDGYYTGEKDNMFGVRGETDRDANQLFTEARRAYASGEMRRVDVDFRVDFRAGRQAGLAAADADGHKAVVYGGVPEIAKSASLTLDGVSAQLYKTGGTPYRCRDVDGVIEPGLYLPAAAVNELRRAVLADLTEQRGQPPRRRRGNMPRVYPGARAARPVLNLQVLTAEQLTPELAETKPANLYVPLEVLAEAPEAVRPFTDAGAGVVAVLPRVITDTEAAEVVKLLKTVYDAGVREALAGNLGHIALARAAGFAVRGDFGLNVFNSQTMQVLADAGLKSATASFELRLAQIRDLTKCLDTEMILYGRLPCMVSDQCVIYRASGSHSCQTTSASLSDRMGSMFPVVREFGCRNVILNAHKLFLADKLDDVMGCGLWAGRLMFTTESPRECVMVTKAYQGLSDYRPNGLTRGLYYRGVE
jgi:putative protease